jgi:membrane-associated phospholipid phosphatase
MQLRLPHVRRGNRLAAVIVGGALVIALYLLPSRLQLRPAITLDRSFIDAWVPFLGWTIWVYLSEYPFMVLALWLGTDDRERSRLFYAFILAATIGLVIFVLWPTAVARESPGSDGLTGLLWRWLYSVDTPANALPSLHVANTCLAAARLRWCGGGWRVIAPVWAVLIVLSTLTTKQHYAIDIAGGVALAAVCFVAVRACLHFRDPVPGTRFGSSATP